MSLSWFSDVSRLDDLFEGLPSHLSVDELAEVLGITRPTVYRYLQRGVLPAYKVESTWVILRDEIKDYLRSHRNEAPDNGAPPPLAGGQDPAAEG